MSCAWDDAGVVPFDCDAHANPVQVLRIDDEATYSVAELTVVRTAADSRDGAGSSPTALGVVVAKTSYFQLLI